MRRRAFAILAATSLILWLAVSALWLRSHWVADSVSWGQARGGVTARASRGRLAVFRYHDIYRRPAQGLHYERGVPEKLQTARPPLAEDYFSTPAFTFHTGRFWWTGTTFWELIVPFWLPAALLATPPALWLSARWRRRRRERLQGFRVLAVRERGGGITNEQVPTTSK